MHVPVNRGIRLRRTRVARWRAVIAVAIGLGLAWAFAPRPLGGGGWALQPAREVIAAVSRARAVAATRAEPGWEERRVGGAWVRYRPGDEPLADLVGEVVQSASGRVAELLGHRPDRPPIIVVHPDRASLRAAYGWGEGERALGVYSAGVIRLLSPRVWIPARDPEVVARVFRSNGPVAHELAHFVLDDATAGNYPHWFSEGLAQWVEYRLTGYQWIEPAALKGRAPYPYEAIAGDFERLPNQAMAYRQAFLLVAELERRAGEDGVRRLIAELRRGRDFDLAFAAVAGRSPAALAEGAWRKPLEAGRTPLAP